MQDQLIGMVRYDELLNTLNALALTGGCDNRTLLIVAAAWGLDSYLKLPQPQPAITVESPAKLLTPNGQ